MPDIVSATDYSSFGVSLLGRQLNASNVEYGFNGKWNEIETGYQNYGMRDYSARARRFVSVDPLTKKYPYFSPYQFAGNSPLKFVDLDGLEPAQNPKDPANQNGRNPTSTINRIYKWSGGNKTYTHTFIKYMKGKYDANATVSGITSKEGYTSDSQNGADIGNLWVDNKGVFKAEDYKDFNTRELSNFLLGNMINGNGPENIEFPTNGVVSNEMRDAGIVKEAMSSWYILNKGQKELVSGSAEFSGNKYMPGAFVSSGMFSPESFIGSATVTISPLNEKQVLVKIFNVTSLTSGDLLKSLPWNKVPISVVRDPNKTNNSSANKYGNISQTYSFTSDIDFSRLRN